MLAAFAADLYGEIAKRDGNLVFSPYSVAIALAMTRAGAAGATREEMDKVLHAALAGDVDAGLNALDQTLVARARDYPFGNTTVPLELGTANELFVQRDFEIASAYLDRLATYYGAGVGIVDYVGAREAARKTINDWVSDRTKARIPQLIPQGVLDETTRLVLTNAAYLKAKWQLPFAKAATTTAPFHRLDGGDVQVQLMHQATLPNWLYARGAGYQAVSIPYVGGLSMVLVVPDAGAFSSVEAILRDPTRLARTTALSERRAVRLAMPRFEFRTSAALKAALSRLGMPIAFTESADFSGITSREPLRIQDVAHEAFISVDEEGTEAAAATAAIVGLTGMPSDIIDLTIDRPFFFFVRDDDTGAIVFMGRVLDPIAR
jgi:serpin B